MCIKKFLKEMISALTVICIILFSASTSVCHAASDYIEFDCSKVPVLEPWANYQFMLDRYDKSKFTEDTEIVVIYSYTAQSGSVSILNCPLQVITQSWSSPDTPKANSTGHVWEVVEPYEWDKTCAKYSLAAVKEAFGTDDLSKLDAINVGATTNTMLTIESVTITNCKEGVYSGLTDAEKAEKYKTALIIVLASALALIIIIITVFMIILKKKTSYVYNAALGQYVKVEKKKKTKKQTDKPSETTTATTTE